MTPQPRISRLQKIWKLRKEKAQGADFVCLFEGLGPPVCLDSKLIFHIFKKRNFKGRT